MSTTPAAPFIPFSRPTLGREEEEAVLAVLRSGWLTTAGVTAAFEQEFARMVGTRHALALSSATAGLHLALEAVGVGPGTVVATTPYTFAATAEVVRYLGADPVFVDIDRDTLNIDPARLQERLEELSAAGRRVTAIVPVHLAGLPCDMDAIRHLSLRFGAPVVEDAAHAFPVRQGDRWVGTLGDAGVFSFYATKTMTTGEGGMVATDRDEVAARIRVMRLHGIDRDVWNRYTEPGSSWKYDVVAPGYKYNMTDIAAAIGRVQLGRAAGFLQRRREIAKRYLAALGGLDFLTLPRWSDSHAWHLFVIRVNEQRLRKTRDECIQRLEAAGIGVSVHFIPLHLMSYYKTRYNLRPEDFPIALDCYKGSISIPISAGHTDDEVDRVITAVAGLRDS
ncbi:MAG TPA: DegT/DnrJ/EryC1/StrS aminotransferase family protein [Spirochaetia bacterium]|nr:DegT/DnrJ/EryC1/StrS aminotransferase family protein [Spirochaetia bacterium]